ncbi:MAG: hypothetical protein ABH871_06395 [Pseudomonadota bacterium]
MTQLGGSALVQDIGNALGDRNDPVGALLSWQGLKGLRPEGFSADDEKAERKLKSAVKKGIESYFKANKVPKRMIKVSYEQGLRLSYNIPADISVADRTLVISAIKALFEASVSLLGEENEQGYPVRYIGPYRMVLIPAGLFVMGAALIICEVNLSTS